jgi:hypothetical protein
MAIDPHKSSICEIYLLWRRASIPFSRNPVLARSEGAGEIMMIPA